MTHTSGIIRYEFDDKFTKDLRANPGKTWTPEEEVAYPFDTKAPFAAGQGRDYSDETYVVLRMMVHDFPGGPGGVRRAHLRGPAPAEGGFHGTVGVRRLSGHRREAG